MPPTGTRHSFRFGASGSRSSWQRPDAVAHIVDAGRWPLAIPRYRWIALVASIALHAIAAAAIGSLAVRLGAPADVGAMLVAQQPRCEEITRHLVFVAHETSLPAGGGGGGGGNRQRAPVRHAEGIGSDPITLRVAAPVSTTGSRDAALMIPEVVLDARPLASGMVDQIGLPVGGVSFGTSTGPGSGGGIGDGIGTGIGSGRGPGIGPGSGGGIGGGVYRPGGSVTVPRVITEVKPSYTHQALLAKIQGTVLLELVVRANGVPANIRVLRSLDPQLDDQAIAAAREWRFEPGRRAGTPVDVIVTIALDFRIW